MSNMVTCEYCHGTGSAICKACGEIGKVDCPDCDGSGKLSFICPECNEGQVPDPRAMDDDETMSREEFLIELKITFIAYYRSGKRVYSLDFPWVRGDKDGVVVLFDENDKATVLEDSDYDRNFMSLIYPEKSDEEA